MWSDRCFCEHCREKDQNYFDLDSKNGQWLEEMGTMIEAAVSGLKRQQLAHSCCSGAQKTPAPRSRP